MKARNDIGWREVRLVSRRQDHADLELMSLALRMLVREDLDLDLVYARLVVEDGVGWRKPPGLVEESFGGIDDFSVNGNPGPSCRRVGTPVDQGD
jgi:hypothetical protein